jgi:hypothetical protein
MQRRGLGRQTLAFRHSRAVEAAWKGVEWFGIFSRSAQPVHLQQSRLPLLSRQVHKRRLLLATNIHTTHSHCLWSQLSPLFPLPHSRGDFSVSLLLFLLSAFLPRTRAFFTCKADLHLGDYGQSWPQGSTLTCIKISATPRLALSTNHSYTWLHCPSTRLLRPR